MIELRGHQEVGNRVGLSRSRIAVLSRERGFPAPIRRVGMMNVWSSVDIDDWHRKRNARLKRRTEIRALPREPLTQARGGIYRTADRRYEVRRRGYSEGWNLFRCDPPHPDPLTAKPFETRVEAVAIGLPALRERDQRDTITGFREVASVIGVPIADARTLARSDVGFPRAVDREGRGGQPVFRRTEMEDYRGRYELLLEGLQRGASDHAFRRDDRRRAIKAAVSASRAMAIKQYGTAPPDDEVWGYRAVGKLIGTSREGARLRHMADPRFPEVLGRAEAAGRPRRWKTSAVLAYRDLYAQEPRAVVRGGSISTDPEPLSRITPTSFQTRDGEFTFTKDQAGAWTLARSGGGPPMIAGVPLTNARIALLRLRTRAGVTILAPHQSSEV